MKREIGIVGAGVAGLHLGLYLQKHGVDATIITDRSPTEYVSARLLNTVGHHFAAVDRERYLGVDHWPDPKGYYYYHDHFLNFPEPLHFRGDFEKQGRAVDYRVYLPLLMQDFLERGGSIEYRHIKDDEIGKLAARFGLLVVSSGRGALAEMFAHRAEHMPFTQPQRRLFVGLYSGVRHPERMNLTLSASPGHGEMIVIPTLTFGGLATALLMENIPGGDLEDLASLSYEKDPKHFRQTVLAKLEKHHPSTYNRIDTQRFDLMQPQDFLQGGVVPTVRNTVVELDDGKCAIALGDVHSVVDPLMGQGANVASYAAFVLGEEIVKADALGANTAALGRRGAKMAIEEIAAIFLLRQRSEGRSSEGRVAPGRDRSKVSKRYGMSCGQDGQVFRGEVTGTITYAKMPRDLPMDAARADKSCSRPSFPALVN